METDRVPRGLHSIALILEGLPAGERREVQDDIAHAHLASLGGAVDMALHRAIRHTRGEEAAAEWSSRANPARYTDRDFWLKAVREGTAEDLREQGFQLPKDTAETALVRLERLRELHGRIAALQAEEAELAADLANSGLPGMVNGVAEAVEIHPEEVRRLYCGAGD